MPDSRRQHDTQHTGGQTLLAAILQLRSHGSGEESVGGPKAAFGNGQSFSAGTVFV